MKSALKLVLFPFFAMGVYGADEVNTVKEGESVTLNSGVTEIQRSDEMEWRLNGKRIFRISSDSVSDDTNGAHGGRMQPDKQTGDLKITDIKTTDSGEYILKIRNTRGSSEKTFSVSVVPESGLSPGAITGIVLGVIVGVVAVGVCFYFGYWKKRQLL